jgi:hypothetical protein
MLVATSIRSNVIEATAQVSVDVLMLLRNLTIPRPSL